MGAAPRLFGFQAEGAAPLVHGAPVANPETVASAIRIGNPARWEEAMEALTRLARARSPRSPTRRSSTPTASWPPTRASSASRRSAASVAGLLAHGVDGAERVVCVLTGHGLKDPQTALSQAGAVVPCEPDIAAVERAVLVMNRRRLVRVPASSANLGPGFDAFAAALDLHMEVEVVETGRFAVHTDLRIARDRRNLVRPRVRAPAPAGRLRVHDPSDIPLSGGLGSSAAAIVAGLLAAD